MKTISIPIISTFLFILTGCAHNKQSSILGHWISPTDKGGSLEFKEDGVLTTHMRFKPDTSDVIFPFDASEVQFKDMEIPGSWKMINNSNIVMNIEFINETFIITNSIVQISDNEMIMNINGKNTIYTRIE